MIENVFPDLSENPKTVQIEVNGQQADCTSDDKGNIIPSIVENYANLIGQTNE